VRVLLDLVLRRYTMSSLPRRALTGENVSQTVRYLLDTPALVVCLVQCIPGVSLHW